MGDSDTTSSSTSAGRPKKPQVNISPAAASTRESQQFPRDFSIDKSRPKDFDGELQTTSEAPSAELLKKIEDYIVLDRTGKSHAFKSLYSGKNVARRVLIIFVRHFFCGNCQEYLQLLSECITPDALLRLPISTFIAVVGCGDPALIDMYKEATNCPFPIYTDPTRSLFDALGLVKTWSMGEKPAYTRKPTPKGIFDSFVQAVKYIPVGLAHKSGDARQVGGEFLFEPSDIATPISTPTETQLQAGSSFRGPEYRPNAREEEEGIEEKRVTWCHRMKTTRDHAEIPELMEILGLDSQGQAIKDEKRWAEAAGKRKGAGHSMAEQMNQL